MLDLREWSARHQLAFWRAGVMVAAISFALGAVVWHLQADERAETLVHLGQVRAAADELSRAQTGGLPVDSFVSALPGTLQAEQIVQRLAETALLQAAVLTDSRVEQARLVSNAELTRASLSFNLRGTYPAIKATLAEVLARTGHATLQSLNIRREAKPEVEAQVVLSLWLRPPLAASRPAN